MIEFSTGFWRNLVKIFYFSIYVHVFRVTVATEISNKSSKGNKFRRFNIKMKEKKNRFSEELTTNTTEVNLIYNNNNNNIIIIFVFTIFYYDTGFGERILLSLPLYFPPPSHTHVGILARFDGHPSTHTRRPTGIILYRGFRTPLP